MGDLYTKFLTSYVNDLSIQIHMLAKTSSLLSLDIYYVICIDIPIENP